MRRASFLAELREELSFELPERLVKENVDYYNQYISDEVKNGKTEKQVIEELGDPQLIARSVIEAAKSGADGIPGSSDDVNFREEIYGSGKQETPEVDENGNASSGRKRSAGSTGRKKSPAKEQDGKFSVNGREFGCGGCLIILLIGVGIWSLIMAILSRMDPSMSFVIILLLGFILLFTRGKR